MGDYKTDQEWFELDRKHEANLKLLSDYLRRFGIDVPASKVTGLLRPRKFVKSTKVRRDSRIVYNVPRQRGAWMSFSKSLFKGGTDGAPDVLTAYFGPPALAEIFKEPPDGLTDPEWAEWAVQKISN